MKQFFLAILLLISFNCLSQTMTEKWNSYNNRYEYFDSEGNMTAYKIYNSYKRQWETYTVKKQTTYKAESSINQPLMEKALLAKQERYNVNIQKIKERVDNAYFNIERVIRYKNLGAQREVATINKYRKIYYDLYASKTSSYDYSSNQTTESVINWLLNGEIETMGKFVEEIEQQ